MMVSRLSFFLSDIVFLGWIEVLFCASRQASATALPPAVACDMIDERNGIDMQGFCRIIAFIFAWLWACAAGAQPYPAKIVRVVTGSVAGGGADITAGPLAQRLGEILKTQVIVDNRPGA